MTDFKELERQAIALAEEFAGSVELCGALANAQAASAGEVLGTGGSNSSVDLVASLHGKPFALSRRFLSSF